MISWLVFHHMMMHVYLPGSSCTTPDCNMFLGWVNSVHTCRDGRVFLSPSENPTASQV